MKGRGGRDFVKRLEMVAVWLRGTGNNILLSHIWCSGWSVAIVTCQN